MTDIHPSTEALGDDDLARLDELLEALNPGEAMVIEELDGFFTSLICSGETSGAAPYISTALGSEEPPPICYRDAAAGAELEFLLERHWRSIAQALASGETLAPLLSDENSGLNPGNLWALGFLRGIESRPDPWDEIDEETLETWLEPVETLAEEIDFETGESRLQLTSEDRAQLVDEMFDTVFDAYQLCVSGRH